MHSVFLSLFFKTLAKYGVSFQGGIPPPPPPGGFFSLNAPPLASSHQPKTKLKTLNWTKVAQVGGINLN